LGGHDDVEADPPPGGGEGKEVGVRGGGDDPGGAEPVAAPPQAGRLRGEGAVVVRPVAQRRAEGGHVVLQEDRRPRAGRRGGRPARAPFRSGRGRCVPPGGGSNGARPCRTRGRSRWGGTRWNARGGRRRVRPRGRRWWPGRWRVGAAFLPSRSAAPGLFP